MRGDETWPSRGAASNPDARRCLAVLTHQRRVEDDRLLWSSAKPELEGLGSRGAQGSSVGQASQPIAAGAAALVYRKTYRHTNTEQ